MFHCCYDRKTIPYFLKKEMHRKRAIFHQKKIFVFQSHHGTHNGVRCVLNTSYNNTITAYKQLEINISWIVIRLIWFIFIIEWAKPSSAWIHWIYLWIWFGAAINHRRCPTSRMLEKKKFLFSQIALQMVCHISYFYKLRSSNKQIYWKIILFFRNWIVWQLEASRRGWNSFIYGGVQPDAIVAVHIRPDRRRWHHVTDEHRLVKISLFNTLSNGVRCGVSIWILSMCNVLS